MIRFYIGVERVGGLLPQLAVGWLWSIASPSHVPITLNVTNLGARGDAVQFSANTVSNPTLITIQSTN